MGIRRLVGIGLAAGSTAVAAVLGAYWWFTDGPGVEVEPAAAPSAASVVGDWRLADGSGQIRLAADGRFSATGLPDEVFHYGSDRTFAGAGRWRLDADRGSVQLDTSSLTTPSDWAGGPALMVVSNGDGLQLCVSSTAPGTLCDYLLQRQMR
jgi:hypothetical protein